MKLVEKNPTDKDYQDFLNTYTDTFNDFTELKENIIKYKKVYVYALSIKNQIETLIYEPLQELLQPNQSNGE